jgi:hypothetical protein
MSQMTAAATISMIEANVTFGQGASCLAGRPDAL